MITTPKRIPRRQDTAIHFECRMGFSTIAYVRAARTNEARIVSSRCDKESGLDEDSAAMVRTGQLHR